MLNHSTINSLSVNEWEDETLEDKKKFEKIEKEIENLYPSGSLLDKGAAGAGTVMSRISDPNIINWTYRDQGGTDYGIDAYFEIKENNLATGRLIAAQIKYGESYVTDKGDYFVFYGKYKHLLYWLNYSLPVIIVYVEKKETSEGLVDRCYWTEVKTEKVKTLKSTWKIKIPKNQVLEKSCIAQLEQVAPKKSDFDLRLTALKLQLPFMHHLSKGGKIAIEFRDTKKDMESLFILEDEKGNRIKEINWKNIFPIEQIFGDRKRFPLPWAVSYGENEGVFEEEITLTEEEKIEILSAIHSSEDIQQGNYFKLYVELSKFGKEFLNIVSYLKDGNF